jgi:putative hydrolase of the HAD superfamily
MRQVLTERWKIADAFDELIISAEVGIAKPDPRIYHLALERLGVAAGEAVFVDDFLENIDAAQALGLHTVHFRNPDQARTELDHLLDGVVAD